MECIRADYSVHNHEVACLKCLKDQKFEGNNDSLRLILRIVAMKHLEESESNSKRSPDQDVDSDTTSNESPSHPNNGRANKFQHIMSLESVTSQISDGDSAAVAQVAGMLHEVVDIAKNDENFEVELPDIEQLMYSIQCNAHRIIDSENRPVALGLFPLTSMMNHSCVPNCAHHFVVEQGKPPRLMMRATRDVSMGEELTYSYVALYDGTSDRRNKLMAAYGFSCDCFRCNANISSDSCASDDVVSTSFDNESSVHAAICKVQRELTVCEQLLSSNPHGAFTVYTKLRSILHSKETDLSGISPSHKILLNAYVLLVRAGLFTLIQGNEREDVCEDKIVDICSFVFYYGLLATGLVLHFTAVDSVELVSLLLSIVHVLKTYEEYGFNVLNSNSTSLGEMTSEMLKIGGSEFIFKGDSLVIKTLNEVLETIQSRTDLLDAEGNGKIMIEDESSHHIVGRLCYDMLRNVRGDCSIEVFEKDLKYLAIPTETVTDMIYYSIDIKLEVEKEHKRQIHEQEEIERLERVELAKAALKSKKGKPTGGAGTGKNGASSQSRDNVNVNKNNENGEQHQVTRLVSNRMQREFGAKKRIKP